MNSESGKSKAPILKLRGKLMVIMAIQLMIFGVVIFLIVNFQFRSFVTNNLLSSTSNLGYTLLEKDYPGDWKIDGDKLYKGSKLINDDTAIVDMIKEKTGSLATIFMGDTRIATNVTKADGSRAIGTKAADNVVMEVLKGGSIYKGAADVAGKRCQTMYMPLKDASGNVVGMWFVGIEESVINHEVFALNRWIAYADVIMLIINMIIFGFIISKMISEVKKVFVGKDQILARVLTAILAGGHILLEDIPGVGKTTMALAFSKALALDYSRMQFTPDVLPSDIVGFSVLNKNTGDMEYKKGAVICNLFLADELNRATSRTQAALLEAMEENQVTVDGVSHLLPRPFMVIATQNPAGAAGTQLLPDSRIDRFMVKLSIGYPSA
jgi:hypothetical protein